MQEIKYAGIDLHQSTCLIAVHDQEDKALSETILKALLFPRARLLTRFAALMGQPRDLGRIDGTASNNGCDIPCNQYDGTELYQPVPRKQSNIVLGHLACLCLERGE